MQYERVILRASVTTINWKHHIRSIHSLVCSDLYLLFVEQTICNSLRKRSLCSLRHKVGQYRIDRLECQLLGAFWNSYFPTSLAKGSYVLGRILSSCLFVSNIAKKRYEWNAMKFYGEVWGGSMKNWWNFGGDWGLLGWLSKTLNNICPDPEPLGVAFHHQCPTFINAYCQAATNLVDQY